MKITIASYDQADAMLRLGRHDVTHVISINDPELHPPMGVLDFEGPRCLLRFDDVPRPIEDAHSHGLKPPHPADMRRIIEFSRLLEEHDHVLMHCAQGRSRSPAAALAILASRVATPSPESGAKVMADLLAIRAFIMPNELMVWHADDALQWGGKLHAAYRRTFKAGTAIWTPPSTQEQ